MPFTEMISSPPLAASETTAEGGGATVFSILPADILETHILTRLDGPALASAASCSTTLRHLSSRDELWHDICQSTWPSSSSPSVSHVISTYPNGGPRAFFSRAYSIPAAAGRSSSTSLPSELISAVDIFFKDKLIFTKVQETETVTGWFRCSPFRIDLLEPKDVVPTSLKHPEGDDTCTDISREMRLSWILIDPIGRRAVNLSSHEPVLVQRHWLTGEVLVRFASIHGHVNCGAVVTCGGSESGEMQVREVSLEMEDMDGTHLNGKDSLVILHAALEGKKGTGKNRVQEAKRRYEEYVEMKRERRERKLRREGTLDTMCVAFGVSIFVAFSFLLLRR